MSASLSNQEREMVADALALTLVDGYAPHSKAFRVKHEGSRTIIAALGDAGFLAQRVDIVRPTLKGLIALGGDQVASLLDNTFAVLKKLQALFLSSPDGSWTVADVDNESVATRLSLALIGDLPSCYAVRSHSIMERASRDATFTIGEPILDVTADHIRSGHFLAPEASATDAELSDALVQLARLTVESDRTSARAFRLSDDRFRRAYPSLSKRKLIDGEGDCWPTLLGLQFARGEPATSLLREAAALLPVLQNAYRERQGTHSWSQLAARCNIAVPRIRRLIGVLDLLRPAYSVYSSMSGSDKDGEIELEEGVLDIKPTMLFEAPVARSSKQGKLRDESSQEQRKRPEASPRARGQKEVNVVELREPRTNDVIGPWKLGKELGAGGQGKLWKARPATVAKAPPRAIKLCFPENNKAADRFRNEISFLRKIAHPNIASYVDSASELRSYHPQIRPCLFLVMELCLGDLADVSRTWLAPARALRYFRDACAGIAHLHTLGLVHRDLKPDNLLVGDEPHRAVVGDLGIASVVEDQGTLTLTNEVVGSRYYRSPEVLLGGDATAQSDIYSLGRILEYLFTHKVPNNQFPRTVASDEISQPLADKIDSIIRKATSFDPAARYHTVGEMLSALPQVVAELVAPTSIRDLTSQAATQIDDGLMGTTFRESPSADAMSTPTSVDPASVVPLLNFDEPWAHFCSDEAGRTRVDVALNELDAVALSALIERSLAVETETLEVVRQRDALFIAVGATLFLRPDVHLPHELLQQLLSAVAPSWRNAHAGAPTVSPRSRPGIEAHNEDGMAFVAATWSWSLRFDAATRPEVPGDLFPGWSLDWSWTSVPVWFRHLRGEGRVGRWLLLLASELVPRLSGEPRLTALPPLFAANMTSALLDMGSADSQFVYSDWALAWAAERDPRGTWALALRTMGVTQTWSRMRDLNVDSLPDDLEELVAALPTERRGGAWNPDLPARLRLAMVRAALRAGEAHAVVDLEALANEPGLEIDFVSSQLAPFLEQSVVSEIPGVGSAAAVLLWRCAPDSARRILAVERAESVQLRLMYGAPDEDLRLALEAMRGTSLTDSMCTLVRSVQMNRPVLAELAFTLLQG